MRMASALSTCATNGRPCIWRRPMPNSPGELGVALVTAGPGITNAMTGIANAHVSRAPVLVIAGGNPRPQENRGGLQDMDQTQLVRSITRYARTVREPSLAPAELDEAISRAFGEGGEPGPSYIDFPVDTLRGIVPKALQLDEHFRPSRAWSHCPIRRRSRRGGSAVVGEPGAGDLRPRRARRRSRTRCAARSAWGRLSRYRREPRAGARSHPSVVGAMRGAVMGDADVVLTIGRRLDFQLAYGSPAVFGSAKFVRISDTRRK